MIDLSDWYDAHGRTTLPWRTTRDPYAIYVSEIMLQQTQVKTVLERYYFPFLKRFPTLELLAAAPQEKVLKAWQGLGYYNRAINLHRAAYMAGHQLPDTYESLMALPGIGKNTAHAILAFAFHTPVAVMEANVKRIVARVFALEFPTEKELWEKADALLNRRDPFTHNQAMMDIGALICTPRNPSCAICPLAPICKGKHAPETYPQKKPKRVVPVRERLILVEETGEGKYLVAPRTTRFLQGLYGFSETMNLTPPDAAQYLGEVTQAYSHFTLQAKIYLVKTIKGSGKSLKQIEALPLSEADRKVWKLLQSYQKT